MKQRALFHYFLKTILRDSAGICLTVTAIILLPSLLGQLFHFEMTNSGLYPSIYIFLILIMPFIYFKEFFFISQEFLVSRKALLRIFCLNLFILSLLVLSYGLLLDFLATFVFKLSTYQSSIFEQGQTLNFVNILQLFFGPLLDALLSAMESLFIRLLFLAFSKITLLFILGGITGSIIALKDFFFPFLDACIRATNQLFYSLPITLVSIALLALVYAACYGLLTLTTATGKTEDLEG